MVALEARPPSQVSTSPTESRGIVLVEVWDIETTSLVENFETREVQFESSSIARVDPPEPEGAAIFGEEAEKSPAAAIAALVRSRTVGPENGSSTPAAVHAPDPEATDSTRQTSAWTQPDVCAMVGGSDFGGLAGAPRGEFGNMDEADGSSVKTSGRGFIITGSEDRKIRLWDLNRMDRSVVLSGGDIEGEKPTFKTLRATNAGTSVHVETASRSGLQYGNQNQRAASRTNLITHHQQNLLKAHQDCITALACIDSPFRGGIVSGDRAGVIKVWRVEDSQ